MSSRKLMTGSTALLSLGLMAAAPASAAIVTLCGPNVCYEYDNNPAANAGITLFGAPSLLGFSDTLQFTPTAFHADSDPLTAIPGPTVSAVFQFTKVWATNGGEIAMITVVESGDYQILGNGAVNANLRLQVVDQVNDNGLPTFPEVSAPQFNWNTATPTGFALQNWSLAGSVTPAATFNDLANVVNLQIQNVLQAFAFESGSYAYIAKKLTLTTTTTVIPVPGAVWLFGSALAAFGWLRRRPA